MNNVSLVNLKGQNSFISSINTPNFAFQRQKGDLSMLPESQNLPSARFENSQESKRGEVNAIDDDFAYFDFEAPREVYIHKRHNQLQDINTRYQDPDESEGEEIPTVEKSSRRPLKQIDTNWEQSSQHPREIEYEIRPQVKFITDTEDKENADINTHSQGMKTPSNLFRKVFESDKEFQNLISPINLTGKMKTKLDDSKNETNPYWNMDLSATSQIDLNDENMLSFSSKANTKLEIGHLTKGNEYVHGDTSKISTIRSVSDLELTSKINQWNASPNTRRIIAAQNKKIKQLQQKVVQLSKDKEKTTDLLQNIDLSKFVDRSELMSILSKFSQKQPSQYSKRCDSITAASDLLSQAANSEQPMQQRTNSAQRQPYQYHQQTKSQIMPQQINENYQFNTEDLQNDRSMIVNEGPCFKADSEVSQNQIAYNSCIRIQHSNLNKIEETAKYEEENSVSSPQQLSYITNSHKMGFMGYAIAHGQQESYDKDISVIFKTDESMK